MLQNGKLVYKDDLVFYNNLRHRTGAVQHMGDNLTGAGEGDEYAFRPAGELPAKGFLQKLRGWEEEIASYLAGSEKLYLQKFVDSGNCIEGNLTFYKSFWALGAHKC